MVETLRRKKWAAVLLIFNGFNSLRWARAVQTVSIHADITSPSSVSDQGRTLLRREGQEAHEDPQDPQEAQAQADGEMSPWGFESYDGNTHRRWAYFDNNAIVGTKNANGTNNNATTGQSNATVTITLANGTHVTVNAADYAQQIAGQDADDHTDFSRPRIEWDTVNRTALDQVLTCPGSFRKKENFSKPNMCANRHKKPNCTWDDFVQTGIADACGEDCFCESPSAEQMMEIHVCGEMCRTDDDCIFTYTSNFGCRVYDSCNETEGNLSQDELDHAVDWVTCERFFKKYTNQTISLFNRRWSKWIMVDKYDGKLKVPAGGVESAENLALEFRFIVAPTTNLYALNQLSAAPGSNYSVGQQSVPMALPPLEGGVELGGGGQIALYVMSGPLGAKWLSVDPQTGEISLGSTVNKYSIWTVTDEGDIDITVNNQTKTYAQIGLYNYGRTGFLSVVGEENIVQVGYGESPDMKLSNNMPEAKFEVILPPRLTGRETDDDAYSDALPPSNGEHDHGQPGS